MIPAVAACFVALTAAVLYPKLRTQTPEIIPPPAVGTETTTRTTSCQESTAFTTAAPESKTSTTQTTAHPASVTSRTATTAMTVTVHTTAQTTQSTASVGTTAPRQTAASERTEPQQTDQPATTTQKQTKAPVHTGSTNVTTVTTTEPQPVTIEVPLWTGYIIDESSIWDEVPGEGKMDFQSWFRVFPSVQPDPFFGLSDQYELFYEEFSVPQEFDLTQNRCLEITIQTAYTKTAVIGCRYTQNGLTLTVAYLEGGGFANQNIRYAIPLPDELNVLPENCCAEFVPVTDETEYQALLTNSLTVEMDD